jgi:hypothetical protein
MKNFVATTALVLSFSAASGLAQPVAQLLEKGIYYQETAGDYDAAIQIYRQIVTSSSDRTIAAQAQFRLTETLLAKADLTAAGEEFAKLARDFADSRPLVSVMAARIHALGENGVPQILGTFRNGRYHHNLTGTELTVPPDWQFRSQKGQPDGGDRIDLADSNGRGTAFFWVRQVDTPTEQIAERLRARLDSKLKNQRQDSGEMRGFQLRPGGPQPGLAGGYQTLSAVGDYMDPNGEKMTEYQIFFQSAKTAAFISGRAKFTDFAALQGRFEQMANSVVMP